MFVMHLALGGCMGLPPIRFGLTADTGGHIGYILGAATAQAALPRVRKISIVTRLFEDDRLGAEYARPSEYFDQKIEIIRIATGNRSYLEKAALGRDLPAFTEAFCDHLSHLPAPPDVIHAHFSDASFVASVARARYGIPFVYTPHALGMDKQGQGPGAATLDLRIAAERTAIKQADAIIVSTQNEAEQQVAAYGVAGAEARTVCLPPGAPGQVPDSKAMALRTPVTAALVDPSKPIVLAIARPVRKKNLAALVRAFLATPALIARANLVILAGQHGLGLSTDEEQAVIAELKLLCSHPALKGRVAFPPEHDRMDVAALYQQAAIGGVFVNPAWHEPFGLTLIEAAEAGVPVVATRDGGAADIVASIGHGLLVDPRNEIEIGAICLRIISDPGLHSLFSHAGRANVSRYSWSRYAAESVSRYASLFRKPLLLAADIDNTLTGCHSGAMRFSQWHAGQNMPFVVATGRAFDAARAVLAEWDLPEPDAFIVDVGTRILLRKRNGDWQLCDDYIAQLDGGWDRHAVAEILAGLGLDPQDPGTGGPHKLSFFGTEAQAHAIRAALGAAALGARVIFSHGRLIDVLAPRAGKAAALAWYAATLGFTLGDCIAAGDSGNDLDMLGACGCAIAVANSTGELDALLPRPGLLRVAGHHATGIMQGLAAFGLAPAVSDRAVA